MRRFRRERSHRRNGATKTNGGCGRSAGRRASRADSSGEQRRKYKPHRRRQRLVFAPSFIAAGRLRRPDERPYLFVAFVIFVAFVVKSPKQVPPFVSVPSFLL